MLHTLAVAGLHKRFGDVVALSDVGFEVRGGEIFGLVGSTGAGKTTTMRIMLGVLAADAGRVTFDGRPITREDRARIGYMPEERGLYPRMRVLDHLVYLAELHGATTPAAQTAAEHWILLLGLSDSRYDEVQKLSLGNRQRVQLAAALVHQPRALVLDEPFSGLDPVSVDVMMRVITERAAQGLPVVFSSHQLDLVERLSHRIGIIGKGRMVGVGTAAELTASATTVLRVTAPEAVPGWADDVPGVRILAERPGSAVFELGPDADDQELLQAALATGPVTEFAPHRPSLAEAYRAVVNQR